jgi:GDP-4-dehydro-6-deoxy-D-mannose reductase
MVGSETTGGRTGSAGTVRGTAFVTGGAGFAGCHLRQLLGGEGWNALAPSSAQVDLRDGARLTEALREASPEAVFHLAAFSSPRLSWEQPERALVTNIQMTLNLLEACREAAPEASIVIVSSGQVYGEPESMPVTEEARLEPRNPYAVSKAACDMLGHQYATAHRLRVLRLRPFNHAGPGQSDDYVLSSLARQVAEAEAAGHDAVLRTGDTSSQRDFTDVRDVVRAYVLAASLHEGAFNVCSGHCVSIAELIDLLREEARVEVRQEDDPARMRPNEPPALHGSHARLTEATGWEPQFPLERTVRDTLDWWRERLPRQA